METEVHHITEIWTDEYNTLVQTIMYDPKSPMKKPSVNPNLTRLFIRYYWDKDNNVIKEERPDEN